MKKPLKLYINKQILGLLFHPLSLSLLVTVIILQIFPLNIPKFKVKIQESSRQANANLVVWEDLENDSTSDRVHFGDYSIGYAVVAVYFYPSGRVKEWDIPGKMVSQFNNEFFVIGKVNENSHKEIFAFMQSRDSLFLYHISDFSAQKPVWDQSFISTVNIVNGNSDVSIVSPRLEDLDGDGVNELIFGVNTGFSIKPRAMFVFDFKNDTLFRSVETGNSLKNFLVADINCDHMKEIITMGYAPGNITDTVVEFHDSSNWAMVFDHKLKLLLPPAQFEGRTGATTALDITDTFSCSDLYILWGVPSNNHHGTQLYRITATGEKRLVKEFTEFEKNEFIGYPSFRKTNKNLRLLIPRKNGDILLFDTSFNNYDIISLNRPISYLISKDVDLVGQPEMLAFDLVSKTMTIYRENFSHPASINVECTDPQNTTISLKEIKDQPPLICICSGDLYYLLSYEKNPYWYTRWGFWVATWLAAFLFTLLIRKTTKIQLEKRIKTEKKITELQMKIVRNQMDPHFIMNAINALVDAINREEKEEARENLLHFSKMYRSLVLSADKIKRPLHDELEFTENYLALEQFRFNNRFTYKIEIDPDVDLSWEVPKMVIQSPVENAAKHGLLKKDVGGEIVIRAFRDGQELVLEITDNGIGRQQSARVATTSTGKGLQIMEQFFDLYYKVTGVRVYSEITDLNDPLSGKTGTRVRIVIQLKVIPGKKD